MANVAGPAFVADKTMLLGVKKTAMTVGADAGESVLPMIGTKPAVGGKPQIETIR